MTDDVTKFTHPTLEHTTTIVISPAIDIIHLEYKILELEIALLILHRILLPRRHNPDSFCAQIQPYTGRQPPTRIHDSNHPHDIRGSYFGHR